MSKKHVLDDYKPRSIDDLFGMTSSSTDISSENEKVVEVGISDLHTFKNHPFSVIDDDKMQETVDSIKEHGVLVPGIVRRRASGGYEIISGHRRRRACELAGLETMPVFIRDLTDDEATIVMVDSNIQREEILPSEKAKAYKMKYEALKHQGKNVDGGDSLDQMSQETGESRKTLQRYIKLSEANDDILNMVDEKKIGLTQGVELAALSDEEQEEVVEIVNESAVTPSFAQAKEIKNLSKDGSFDKSAVKEILTGKSEKQEKRGTESIPEKEKETKQKRRVMFEEDELSEYFSESYSEEQIKDITLGLYREWKSKN